MSISALPPSAPVRFSYSTPDQPLVQQAVIRAVEMVGGQRRLRRLYEEQQSGRLPGESFYEAAIRLLALDIAYDRTALADVPARGPLVVVANHPYGVLDGIVLTALMLRVRPDCRILAHEVLYRVPETREHLLPIDFADTRAARATSATSRRAAQAWLAGGGAIGIFPGGGVATTERALSRPVLDLPWHPFLARLVRSSRATVVPVHFSGHNSRLFQLASHVSLTLRLSLLFRETARRIGTSVEVGIGRPIAFAELEPIGETSAFLDDLRKRTYALAPAVVDWSRYGRIRTPPRRRPAVGEARRLPQIY
jgi:putative hemolysin